MKAHPQMAAFGNLAEMNIVGYCAVVLGALVRNFAAALVAAGMKQLAD
jgi:hypothetical protein